MNLIDRAKCSGCTACANVCPKKCIEMVADNEGFLYPEINEAGCVNCGLCKKVCPIEKTDKHNPLSVYAVKNKNDEVRLKSTSGAMFTAIAEYVINNGGVVFGCRFDDTLEVIHDFTDTLEGLCKFRGAKYVQSDLKDNLIKVKKFLESDKYVLFTGTPCQIAGLVSYLGKKYEKLITCDLVCHSVPSPKTLKTYIKELEEKHISKINEICFREKVLEGWHKSNLKVVFENGDIHREILKENIFMKGFNKGLYNRKSCGTCAYKDFRGSSDITIADYWGIENVAEDFSDNIGISLVFINTSFGSSIFDNIKNNLIFIETELQDSITKNPYIIKSSPVHINRDAFFNSIGSKYFSELVEFFLD